jgi:hypothetical protein
MQTFLSSPNFAESAAVLDPKRLNKQIVEGNQILATLVTGSGWSSHPAVLQWKGHERGLVAYIKAFISEAARRGYKTEKGLVNVARYDAAIANSQEIPPWLGDERFHSSHRSRLLFKGRVDSVCGQLKSFLRVRSINTWLKANDYPEKNYFKHPDIERLEFFCRKQFDLQATNYYSQYGWAEDDTQEYYWPVKINA